MTVKGKNEVFFNKSFRRILAQVLASFPKNLLYLNSGFIFALPTITISALSGLNPTVNPNETLMISTEEASWIASLFPMFSIVGSVMSNCMEPLGRKKSLIISFLPFLMGWTLLYYYSNSIEVIYAIMSVLGFGLGFGSPCMTYLSEVCEPKIRAILFAVGMALVACGMALVYVLGNLMPWRDTALIYFAVVFTGLLLSFLIPETPQWLLSRDRPADALKSLRWIRGWAQPDDVRDEFEYLEHHKTVTYVCMDCKKQSIICSHPAPNMIERWREFFQRKTLIPFVIVGSQYFVAAFLGSAFRPYFVQILHDLDSPIDPNLALPWMGYIGFFGNMLLVFVVRPFGKRKIYLITLAAAVLLYFTFGFYAYQGKAFFTGYSAQIIKYFPMVGFITIHLLNNFGFNGIPSLLVGEVFSFRTRGLASALSMAWTFASISLSMKTFYLIESVFTSSGQWIFYGCIGVVQFVMMYLTLPETEGRTLEEIEVYFTDKNRRFNDINIPQVSHLNSNENPSV